jgi:hypothetical protein
MGPGELLFPALYPQTVIDQAKKDPGAAGYAGQHQQRPAPAEGGILQRHWWRYFKPRGLALSSGVRAFAGRIVMYLFPQRPPVFVFAC